MVVTVVAAVGCGDSSSPMAPSVAPPGQAVISVLVSPANSTPSGDPQFPWAASFTVTVSETAGVALQLMEIVIQLDQPVVFDGAFLGTGRIAGGGGPDYKSSRL